MRSIWICLALLGTAAAGQAEDGEDLARRVTELEQRVTRLEQRLDTPEPAIKADALKLVLQDWTLRPVQVKFNTYYALDVTLHNGYSQDIKEIEGRIQFRDRLGGHLYSIVLSESVHLPAGQSGIDPGSAQNKRLLGEGHPLRKIKQQDVAAELVLNKLVFADNSVLSF